MDQETKKKKWWIIPVVIASALIVIVTLIGVLVIILFSAIVHPSGNGKKPQPAQSYVSTQEAQNVTTPESQNEVSDIQDKTDETIQTENPAGDSQNGENRLKEVYRVYLDFLTAHPECRIYDMDNNQKKSIAFFDDITGDYPGICYEMTSDGEYGDELILHLATERDGRVADLFTNDLGTHFAAVGGSYHYEYYADTANHRIYEFYNYGEAGEMGEELSVLEENGGVLEKNTHYVYLGYPAGDGNYIDEYKKDGADIPGNDYKREVGDTLYQGKLFYAGFSFFGSDENSAAYADMMTYDEAIARLQQLIEE